jgi:hypothetical protein
MKTSIEIRDDIYAWLQSSALSGEVTGNITNTGRETDKEDVCISVLASEGTQCQKVYLNVNVYVKDLYVNKTYTENMERAGQLARLCAEVMESHYGDGWMCRLETQSVMEVSATNEHLINNRLYYQIINE